MATVYFHARGKDTIIKERFDKDSKGKEYAELELIQSGITITIFLGRKTSKELLNTVRRIDRRLNKCQKTN